MTPYFSDSELPPDPREDELKQQMFDAALELLKHAGIASFLLPIPGSDNFLVCGPLRSIERLVALSDEPVLSERR